MNAENNIEKKIKTELEELRRRNIKLEEQVHQTIKQLERANEALQESQDLNKSIIRTAADAIISIDSEGFISLWNDAAEKIFGYSSSEILNENLTKIIPEQYRTAHETGLKRLKKGGKEKLLGKTIEIIGLHKDGSALPIELSLSS